MPIIIIYGGRPPLIINDYNGMFLEDIPVEYSTELPYNQDDSSSPFNFIPSPLW